MLQNMHYDAYNGIIWKNFNNLRDIFAKIYKGFNKVIKNIFNNTETRRYTEYL